MVLLRLSATSGCIVVAVLLVVLLWLSATSDCIVVAVLLVVLLWLSAWWYSMVCLLFTMSPELNSDLKINQFSSLY